MIEFVLGYFLGILSIPVIFILHDILFPRNPNICLNCGHAESVHSYPEIGCEKCLDDFDNPITCKRFE
jgi:hypothetical protein